VKDERRETMSDAEKAKLRKALQLVAEKELASIEELKKAGKTVSVEREKYARTFSQMVHGKFATNEDWIELVKFMRMRSCS
jgi:hypothetical protein